MFIVSQKDAFLVPFWMLWWHCRALLWSQVSFFLAQLYFRPFHNVELVWLATVRLRSVIIVRSCYLYILVFHGIRNCYSYYFSARSTKETTIIAFLVLSILLIFLLVLLDELPISCYRFLPCPLKLMLSNNATTPEIRGVARSKQGNRR